MTLISRSLSPAPAPLTADFTREHGLRVAGCWPVAGCDEAGRGPLAGPVAAAAVILDPKNLPTGLADSKKLSAARRDTLFEEILSRALCVSVSLATALEIDALNIRVASLLAMRRSLAALSLQPAHALIDGNVLPEGLTCSATAIIGGDAASMSIAAASIIAKVVRDRLMHNLHRQFPRYGFTQHVGYSTPAHLAALGAHGPCIYHRRSFAPVRAALHGR